MDAIDDLIAKPDVLKTYPFVQDLPKTALTTDVFQNFAEQFRLFLEDDNFRKEIGLKKGRLADEDLWRIAVYYHKPRREFLKTLLGAGLSVPALASPVFAQQRPMARVHELLRIFSKYPELKLAREPVLSPKAGAPIVVIVEDIHGGDDKEEGWKVELLQLELIRRYANINFVGIEGWAGPEVDRKRGRQILNGEEQLIRHLIKNKNYVVVGLEDEKFQSLILNANVFAEFTLLRQKQRKLAQLGVSEDFFRYVFSMFLTIFSKYDGGERDAKAYIKETNEIIEKGKQMYPHVDFGFLLEALYINLETLCLTIKAWRPVPLTEGNLYTLENILQKEVGHFFLPDYPVHPLESSGIKNLQLQRDNAAINIFLSAMRRYRRKEGIVVFGRGHTDGLVSFLLQKLNKEVNIIVII